MLKFVVLLSCLVASLARPAEEQAEVVPIVSMESNVEPDGTFHYSYESGDGTKAEQDGVLKTLDPEHAGEAVHGSYSYISPEGVSISLTYTADENGFVAQGEHLPTAPPVPEAIARAVAYLLSLPATTEKP